MRDARKYMLMFITWCLLALLFKFGYYHSDGSHLFPSSPKSSENRRQSFEARESNFRQVSTVPSPSANSSEKVYLETVTAAGGVTNHLPPQQGNGKSSTETPSSSLQPKQQTLNLKKILFWTPFYGSYKVYDHVFIRLLENDCPVNDCNLTTDRNQFESADVVLFHLVDFTKSTVLPQNRSLNQQWVVYCVEAPPVTQIMGVDFGRLRGIFNWTMSYRQDSDVCEPYGVVIKRDVPEPGVAERDYWSEKTKNKTAAWMVSNCQTHGRREAFVTELKKHMPVDVYGNCGSKKCGLSLAKVSVGLARREDCDELVGRYLFYLAFENAICTDYVTEKFFLALTRPVVPVVFGGANYTAIAPPNSFINALDYGSPRALASALLAIAANRTAYNSYFAWKADYRVDLGDPFRGHICDLCAKAHGAPLQYTKSRYTLEERNRKNDDISSWGEPSTCKQWKMPSPP